MKKGLHAAFRLAQFAGIVLCLAVCLPASVAGPTVLYSFSNSVGQAPASRMVLASDGNLYGTTLRGGANGAGSIFRLALPGSLSNLYSFPPATNSSGETNYDLGPNDLVQGTDGNFYGTTRLGGSNFSGTIFKLSPSGFFTLLHTFAAETLNAQGYETSADGAMPVGALTQGNDGNFYGTTRYGGSNDAGTIFQVTPNGAFTGLYSFILPATGSVATSGAVPNALTLGSDGAFYGTTQQGGPINAGTFFKFTVAGGFTQLYSFNDDTPGNDPITPNSTLVQGANGVFFGTTAYGGTQGGGCIFEITNTGGANVLCSFPELNAGASETLILGSDGIFYGTTAENGVNGQGMLFRSTPQGDYSGYSFSALDTNADNADGANPSAGLTADDVGNYYGTCAAGGTNGSGLIFQILSPTFIPPSFFPSTNWPPAQTNTLVGSSVALSYLAQGIAPISYQWLLNGTNALTNGGDISGSTSGTLTIDPVFSRDIGSYALVISNTWGALTSSVTALTIKPPGITIVSPKPNARTTSRLFSGTATSAPLFPGTPPNLNHLTGVMYSFTNLFSGSNITGTAAVTLGTNSFDWSFTATPFPGTNILSVQSEDASGNISAMASVTFFYEASSRLTILKTGSGTGSFTITNGAVLNLGQSYSITARPLASVFSNWYVGGVISYKPTVQFIMQSNLVLTADFMARQLPVAVITSPKAHERTDALFLEGIAGSSPLLPGASPANVHLTNVVYWLSNGMTGSVITGVAALANGLTFSDWSIAVTNLPGVGPAVQSASSGTMPVLPGTNTLLVQVWDASGGVSAIVSRTFFYKVPALFTLTNAGNGTGTFLAASLVAGDTPPTNGAMLNIGERYKLTAIPGKTSLFVNWLSSSGASSTAPVNSFIMQSNLVLTATFVEIPPVLTVSTPAAHFRTSAPVFAGTASGHLPIANVICALANTNGLAKLTAGANGISNWSVALAPVPGTNYFSAYCVDANSNRSASIYREFFYNVPARLTVTQAGTGSGSFRGAALVAGNTAPADGAKLYIGEGYRITALPDKTSLFSNWVGAAGGSVLEKSGAPSLSFVMQSNLVLTATFITNFFPPLAGTYYGLFFPSSAVGVNTSGMLYNLVLRDTGAFSGKFLTPAGNYAFATSFSASGSADFSAGPFRATLNLDTATSQITGTVSESGVTAGLVADRASNILASAEYTMLFSPSNDVSTNLPPGDGYALVTNHGGVVMLSGALSDGTHFNQTVPVSRGSCVPVYSSLYTQNTNTDRGLLLGWIDLTNLQAAAPTNALTWIKQKKLYHSPALYTNGFTNILSTRGAPWIAPPAGTPALSFTNGELVLSNTDLFLAFTNISVSDDKLADSGGLPTNSLTGTIDFKTGLLTVVFGDGKGRATDSALGALLQDATNAGGFFLTPTNAGSMNLQP